MLAENRINFIFRTNQIQDFLKNIHSITQLGLSEFQIFYPAKFGVSDFFVEFYAKDNETVAGKLFGQKSVSVLMLSYSSIENYYWIFFQLNLHFFTVSQQKAVVESA